MERYKEPNLFKKLSNVAPSNIFDNDRSLTEPQEIANAFNKYFVNVATDIQPSIRDSKHFFVIFPPQLISILFPSTPLMKLKSRI